MDLLNRRIPARIEAIEDLARAVDAALPGENDLVFAVKLCLEELLANTILHGLKGAPDRSIQVQIVRSDAWLEVRIKDDAPRYDPFVQAPKPDLELGVTERPIGGLGVHLVRSMMDEVHAEYDGTGNLIVLRKRLRSRQPGPGPASADSKGT